MFLIYYTPSAHLCNWVVFRTDSSSVIAQIELTMHVTSHDSLPVCFFYE